MSKKSYTSYSYIKQTRVTFLGDKLHTGCPKESSKTWHFCWRHPVHVHLRYSKNIPATLFQAF